MLRKCSARLMSSAVADLPATSCAGFAGTTKKITYVTIVTARKSTHAHRKRRAMYVSIEVPPFVRRSVGVSSDERTSV